MNYAERYIRNIYVERLLRVMQECEQMKVSFTDSLAEARRIHQRQLREAALAAPLPSK